MAARQQEYWEALAAGHALAWEGLWERAAESYRRALDLSPQDQAARVYTAMALARLANTDEALTLVKEAAAGTDYLLLAKAADLAVLSGRPDEATDLRLRTAEALWGRGRRDEAIGVWRSLATLSPGLVAVHERLARAYREAGDLAAAEGEEAFLRDPEPVPEAPVAALHEPVAAQSEMEPLVTPFVAAVEDEVPVAPDLPAALPENEVKADQSKVEAAAESVEAQELLAEDATAEEAIGPDAAPREAEVELATERTGESEVARTEPAPVGQPEEPAPEAAPLSPQDLPVEVAQESEPEISDEPTLAPEPVVAHAIVPPEREPADTVVATDTLVEEAPPEPAHAGPEPAIQPEPVVAEPEAQPEVVAPEPVMNTVESAPLLAAEASADLELEVEPRAGESVADAAEPVAGDGVGFEDSATAEETSDGTTSVEEQTAVPADAMRSPEPAAVTESESTPKEEPRRSWWKGLFGGRESQSEPMPETKPVEASPLREPELPMETESEPALLEPLQSAKTGEAWTSDLIRDDEAEAVELTPTASEVVRAARDDTVEVSPLAEDEPVAAVAEVTEVEDDRAGWLEAWREAALLLRDGQVTLALAAQEQVLDSARSRAPTEQSAAALDRLAAVLPGIDAFAASEARAIPEPQAATALLSLARGAAFAEAGLVTAAVETYEETIARLPEFLPAQIALAHLMAGMGKTDRAREKFAAVAAVCELRGQAEIAELLRALARAA